jgi:hypothetical protein
MARSVVALLMAGLLAGAPSAEEKPIRLLSAEQKVSLIELYTSEGCSSCPPADRWFSALQSDPQLWREFVPVAFHVDYWDYIGWRDRFASPSYSARQRQYAREGGARVVYTPGVFQDGSEWRGWASSGAPEPKHSTPGAITADIEGRRVSIAYRPNVERPGKLIAHVAVLGMGLESDVAAGENSGRTLKHDFVVLGVASKALKEVQDFQVTELQLPETSVDARRYAVAMWITSAVRQAPIQAVGGFLPRATDR